MAKKNEVKLLAVLGNCLLVQEEDESKAVYQKVDLDVDDLLEQLGGEEEEEDEEEEDEEEEDEEEEKPAKKGKKAPAKEEEDEEEEDEEELTYEDLQGMDYEELAELIDDRELEVDAEDFDEDEDDEVEKLRKEIAEELGIEVPRKGKKGKK